ncbi:MAG TPA: hypothetical protein VGC64_00795 [Pyrinomonadaceae bacterium]|jgi:hypothetical protein
MLTQTQTFPCPNCNEIINDTTPVCRFCATPVDRQAAMAAAHIQSQVNQACSDASYMRTAAVLMWAFLGLSFIPLLPAVGWGFIFTFVVVLAMLLRWQFQFGSLQTKDKDYPRARRSKNVALILWLAALLVGFVVKPFLASLIFH